MKNLFFCLWFVGIFLPETATTQKVFASLNILRKHLLQTQFWTDLLQKDARTFDRLTQLEWMQQPEKAEARSEIINKVCKQIYILYMKYVSWRFKLFDILICFARFIHRYMNNRYERKDLQRQIDMSFTRIEALETRTGTNETRLQEMRQALKKSKKMKRQKCMKGRRMKRPKHRQL